MKTCRKCKQNKPLADFTINRKSPDGIDWRCRACQREYREQHPISKATRQRNSAAWRTSQDGRYWEFNQHLKRYHGITAEDWAHLYNKQNGLCAGCADRLAFDRNTHVDHDHATGRIRGLLCAGCNVALGAAQDSIPRLRGLIRYLEG